MKKNLYKILTLVMVFVLCFSMTGCSLFERSSGDISKLPDSGSISTTVKFNTIEESERQVLSRPDAVEKVARSVVAIKMEVNLGNKIATSYGSGVIVDLVTDRPEKDSYYIITCHHVVDSTGKITVYVPDQNSRNTGDSDYNEDYVFTGNITNSKNNEAVTLVGGDKESDIAVLKLNTKGKNVNIVASKTPVSGYVMRQGEDVFAVGNPSGTLPMSVCAGVISYINRPIIVDAVGSMNVVQIDAPINHGSSGGGLYNMYGELIGITNAGSDEYNSLNYSIPFSGTNGFMKIAEHLIKSASDANFGYVTGRWQLGITIEAKTNSVGKSYVAIRTVTPDSNADKAGLYAGDIVEAIIYKVDNKEVNTGEIITVNDFKKAVFEIKKHLSLGDKLEFVVYRNYRKNIVEMTLEKQFIFCDTGYYPE